MGVKIREKVKNSGVWWMFINHKGTRYSQKLGTDKKFAEKTAKELEQKLALGDLHLSELKTKIPTFKEYAEKWLDMPHDRKDSTQRAYKRMLKRHIYPAIGKMRLNVIKRRNLKTLLDSLIKKGMAQSNIGNVKRPMSLIFSQAIMDEYLEISPLVGLSYSTKKQIKIKPLRIEQTVILLDEAKKHREGLFYDHLLTLLRTGMRVGEMSSLKWSDLDFENNAITVQRSVYQGVVGSTKNGKSRVVDMSPELSETLRHRKIAEQKKSLKKGVPFSEWIFTFDGLKPLTPPPLRNAFNTILKSAELSHRRLHDLRHTYGTIRISRGHNLADVSAQMGHSSIQITVDVYNHWQPGQFKNEVAELDTHPTTPHPHLKEMNSKE